MSCYYQFLARGGRAYCMERRSIALNGSAMAWHGMAWHFRDSLLLYCSIPKFLFFFLDPRCLYIHADATFTPLPFSAASCTSGDYRATETETGVTEKGILLGRKRKTKGI